MTAWWVTAAVSLLTAAAVGWFVPAWAMNRLVPVLESRCTVENYRGRRVALGLGIVWLVWAGAWALAQSIWSIVPMALSSMPRVSETVPQLAWGSPWGAVGVNMFLVLGAFAFGLADDMFGDGASRGFGGHLSALRDGRLTTGALKLFGIGALAALAALSGASSLSGIDQVAPGAFAVAMFVTTWVLGTLVIALSANLVNLTDLRPGRALKAYIALAALAVVATAWRGLSTAATTPGASDLGVPPNVNALAVTLTLAILVLGPVAAVWRFDLGERAMLGDAGANAMGALAGYLLVRSLPLWLLAIAAAVLLAINLASEAVSFSEVIDRRPLLRWIDGLGRLHVEADPGAPSPGGMTDERHDDVGPRGDDADPADAGTGKDGGS